MVMAELVAPMVNSVVIVDSTESETKGEGPDWAQVTEVMSVMALMVFESAASGMLGRYGSGVRPGEACSTLEGCSKLVEVGMAGVRLVNVVDAATSSLKTVGAAKLWLDGADDSNGGPGLLVFSRGRLSSMRATSWPCCCLSFSSPGCPSIT